MKEELQPINYKEYGVEIGATYQHYKGNLFKIVGVARHSETLEPLVVYIALYGNGELWARPLTMWNNIVEYEGKKVERFSKIQ